MQSEREYCETAFHIKIELRLDHNEAGLIAPRTLEKHFEILTVVSSIGSTKERSEFCCVPC